MVGVITFFASFVIGLIYLAGVFVSIAAVAFLLPAVVLVMFLLADKVRIGIILYPVAVIFSFLMVSSYINMELSHKPLWALRDGSLLSYIEYIHFKAFMSSVFYTDFSFLGENLGTGIKLSKPVLFKDYISHSDIFFHLGFLTGLLLTVWFFIKGSLKLIDSQV